MAFSFAFFDDPALTTRLPSPLVFVQADAAPVPDDAVIWFGSPDPLVSCVSVTLPGVAPVTVTPIDTGVGTGSPASDVKLALSAAGLDSAVGGAALSLPATVLGGTGNAIAIHMRITDSTHVAGVKSDLSLSTNALGQL